MKILKNFILDLLFPKNCFGCQKEGSYLCEDCTSLLDIIDFHKPFKTKHLDDLYFPLYYKNSSQKYINKLIKTLIHNFKFNPFVKELSKPLSSLIISHLKLIEEPIFSVNKEKGFVIIPVPLSRKRLKWRGFNQAEEIGKHLSLYLKKPLLNNILIKNKETFFQSGLSKEERETNLINSFSLKTENLNNKNVLLIDDIYTTGSTMEECSKILKSFGVNKVIGVVIARTNNPK